MKISNVFFFISRRFFSFLLLLYRSFYTSGTSKSRPLNIKKKRENGKKNTKKMKVQEQSATHIHAQKRKKKKLRKEKEKKREYEAQKLVMNECDRRYRNRY